MSPGCLVILAVYVIAYTGKILGCNSTTEYPLYGTTHVIP
jgi:hypothetical protein